MTTSDGHEARLQRVERELARLRVENSALRRRVRDATIGIGVLIAALAAGFVAPAVGSPVAVALLLAVLFGLGRLGARGAARWRARRRPLAGVRAGSTRHE